MFTIPLFTKIEMKNKTLDNFIIRVYLVIKLKHLANALKHLIFNKIHTYKE
jgi:hypothetical protein